jgi:uncharacterized GH25 family protein
VRGLRFSSSLARIAALAALAAGTLLATPLRAHDFWIEPSTYRPAPGQRLVLRARVGAGFLGDPVPRDEELLVRFVVVGSEGEQPVPGVQGVDPAGIMQARGVGTMVVGYQSRGSVAELTPEKMALYVDQEGLAGQLPSGWQRKPVVRDRFSRSVKSLLLVGGDGGSGARAGYDRLLGLPLELVPLSDPAALAGGGALPVRLLWDGRPAAGIQVTALSRLDPAHPLTARTGADGRVVLPLPRGGEWLLKAVRILPAGGPGADFESVWASLTFTTSEER